MMNNKKLAQAIRKRKIEVTEPVVQSSHLTLGSDVLPGITNWRVGETYTVTLEVKQQSASLNGKETQAGFEILSATTNSQDKKIEEDGYEKNAKGTYIKVEGLSPSVS